MKLCPLCNKELKPVYGIANGLSCQTKVFDEGDVRHYYEDNIRRIIYILPYRVMTINNQFSFIDYLIKSEYPQRWDELTCTSIIHPDTEDNLRKRIKTLLMFI